MTGTTNRSNRSTPGDRLPTVAEEFELSRQARHVESRLPLSTRYFSGARSPVFLVVYVIIAALFYTWVQAHDFHGGPRTRASIRSAKFMTGDGRVVEPYKLAKGVYYRPVGVIEAEVPDSIRAESPAACWASNDLVVDAADTYVDRTGRQLQNLDQLDNVRISDPFSDDSPAPKITLAERLVKNGFRDEAIAKAPAWFPTCGFTAARVLTDAGQQQRAEDTFLRWLPYVAYFLLWLTVVVWSTRVLENLRRSTGRTASMGTAMTAWLPVWVLPFALARIDYFQHTLWAFRLLFITGILVTIIYYAYTRARLAIQVWRGTGLEAPALSALLWAPELIGVTALQAAPLWSSFHPRVTSEGTTWQFDSVGTVLAGVGAIFAAVSIAFVVVFVLIITVSQQVGLARAMRGTETP
jgi:hypothetical protein